MDEAKAFCRKRYADAYKQDCAYRYAICMKSDRTPIGYINASMDDAHDLDYGLREKFWHRGIVTEAGMRYQYSYEEQWQPKDILVTFRVYQLNLNGKDDRVYKKYWDNSTVHFIENHV